MDDEHGTPAPAEDGGSHEADGGSPDARDGSHDAHGDSHGAHDGSHGADGGSHVVEMAAEAAHAAVADAEGFESTVGAIAAAREGHDLEAGAKVGAAVHHAIEAVEKALEAAGVHLGTEAEAAFALAGAAGEVVEKALETVHEIDELAGRHGSDHGRDEHGGGDRQRVDHERAGHRRADDERADRRVDHLFDAAHEEERDIRLEIEIEEALADPLQLVRLEVEERLGALYCARALVAVEVRPSRGPLLSPEALLGAAATARIYRGRRARAVHGIVSRVESVGGGGTHQLVRLEISPALAALAHQVDSRIFCGLKVEEILVGVIDGGLADYDRRVSIEDDTTPNVREYCVQYQESDLDFVHRLMEEEGLTYYFEHGGDREELYVVATNDRFPEVDEAPEGGFVITAHDGALPHAETVIDFVEHRKTTPTDVVIADFDWKRSPTAPFLVTEDDPGDDRGRRRTIYDHSRALDLGNFEGGSGRDDGPYQRRIRRELVRRDAVVATGRSTIIKLQPGRVLKIVDRRDVAASWQSEWLVTGVRHRAYDPRHRAFLDESTLRGPSYENELECIPASTPFRPSRSTPKPRIHGLQTALVVGPPGAVVHSDEHRRVRVRFHWDHQRGRVDSLDDRATCWVRVAQSWAGPGYGAVVLPRVGMEVVVSFLDGDPDRPLVVGCVYNGQNLPPWQSERDWTVSGFQTRTVDGDTLGEGWNELSFDDEKGAEKVYLQAQRNLVELVKNDHSTHVRHDQRNTVDRDQSEKIGRDQDLTVEQDRWKRVRRHEHTFVEGTRTAKIDEDDVLEVLRNEETKVHRRRTLHVHGRDEERFHDARKCVVTGEDRLEVEGNLNVVVSEQHNVTARQRFHLQQGVQQLHLENHTTYLASPDGDIHVTNGKARVQWMPSGELQLESDTKIVLKVGRSFIRVLPDAVEIHSETLRFSGGGNSSFVADATSTEVAGPRVLVQGSGPVDVRGMPVRLNT